MNNPMNVRTGNSSNDLYNYILLSLTMMFLFRIIIRIIKRITLPATPPGPYQYPIFGNLFQLRGNVHIKLTNMAQTYGPIMSVKLGAKLVVVGSTPEAAKEILKTHDSVLSGRHLTNTHPSSIHHINKYSVGFVRECDDQWRQVRAILRAGLFSTVAIQNQAKIREKNVVNLLKKLHAMESKVVNMSELVFKVVLNTMGNILFTKDIFGLGPDERGVNCGDGVIELCHEFLNLLGTLNLADLFPILQGWDIQGKRKEAMEICEKMFDIWKQVLKERRAKGNKTQEDFLDALLENGFSDDHINHLLLELLLAGTDTTCVTIIWALADLIKNKHAMTKLRSEFQTKTKIGDKFIKETDITCLKYLQACIKETMRLHPPIPFLLPHRATESCNVMNYKIPSNTQVMINTWAMSRDPEIWEDPSNYIPERFLESGLDFKGFDFEYVPLGSGRRICPGLNMVALQVPHVVACLVNSFCWFLPELKHSKELDMEEVYHLALRKKNPLEIVPMAF